jgi:carbon monoxide dehydrogenase subunit G
LIDIKEEVEVAAQPDLVWKVVSDPHQVVSCVPGGELAGQREDGTYEGSIGVKFGPTRVSFQMLVTLELNHEARSGKMVSSGSDKRGGTRSKATTTFNVSPAQMSDGSAGSKIAIQSGVDISGPLASLVENGAVFVIRRIMAEFATRLAEKCAGIEGAVPSPAKP